MEEEEQLFKIDIDCDDNDADNKKVDYDVDELLTKSENCNEETEGKATNDNSVSGEKCWNCDKVGHTLRDCPVPRQKNKINRAKKTFMSSQNSSKRYHDNKFSKFRPGYYSSALREALGLKNNEVPQHIYKMRLLGYPPGWLAESKITNSGIKMYNSHGKRVPEVDEEDGEIINKIMKYDVEKLIKFPGFNVPLKKGMKDQCRLYGFPDMKRQDNIQAFIKHLEFLSNNSGDASDSTDDESVDMDVCEIQHSDIIEEGEIVSSPSRSNDTKASDTLEEGELVNSTDSKIETDSSIIKKDESSKINTNETRSSGIEEKSKSDKIEEIETNLNQLNENKQISDSESVTSQTKSSESTQIADDTISNKLSEEVTCSNEPTQTVDKSTPSNSNVSTDKNIEDKLEMSKESSCLESTIKETEIVETGEKSLSKENKKRHITEDCTKECDNDLNIKRRKSDDPVAQNTENTLDRMDKVKTEHDNIPNELKENEIGKSVIEESSKSSSDAIENEILTNESTGENSNNSVTPNEVNGTISPSTNIKRSLPIDIQQNSDDSSPLGSITSSSYGTPNLKSHSPYSKLPSFENFNKDISDVIDFENLPDSVGKYKTMCSTISKIRDFMSSKLSKMKKK